MVTVVFLLMTQYIFTSSFFFASSRSLLRGSAVRPRPGAARRAPRRPTTGPRRASAAGAPAARGSAIATALATALATVPRQDRSASRPAEGTFRPARSQRRAGARGGISRVAARPCQATVRTGALATAGQPATPQRAARRRVPGPSCLGRARGSPPPQAIARPPPSRPRTAAHAPPSSSPAVSLTARQAAMPRRAQETVARATVARATVELPRAPLPPRPGPRRRPRHEQCPPRP